MKKYVILAAVCWFAVISLVGIILTVYDKRIAGSGKRRIPEATLMTVGLLGAAGPMYLTMKKIRHKTKHKKFMLGLPAEVILPRRFISRYPELFLLRQPARARQVKPFS